MSFWCKKEVKTAMQSRQEAYHEYLALAYRLLYNHELKKLA